MRKSRLYLLGMAAVLLAFGVTLAACGGKKNSGGGGGGADGDELKAAAKTVAKAVGKETPASDFTYDLSEDGKGVVIKKYTGDGEKVVIPAKIEGLPVVELFHSSFYGESNSDPRYGPGYDLTSVVIPASVKAIKSMAFNRCEKLTSVTILGTDVEIGSMGFGRCLNLSELNFPENASLKPDGGIGSSGAFDGCKKLPLAVRGKLTAMGFDAP